METIVVMIKTGLDEMSFKFDSWMEAAKFASTVSNIVIPYEKDGKRSDVTINIKAIKEDDENGMDI